MAGLGGKNWAFEEEVTSSDVNGFLADQVVMRFADEATRTAGFGGAGEPTLAEGMVSYLDDVNRLAVYDGSAWVNVPVAGDFGLQLVKTQTIGTAVSSVTVSGAFNSTYDNYRIIISKSDASAINAAVFARCHAGANHDSAFGRVDYTGTATSGSHTNSTSGCYVGFTGANNDTNLAFDLFSPFLAEFKTYSAHGASQSFISYTGGVDKSATSRTDLTITLSSGTLTGGIIRIYGYRNS